MSHTSDYLKTIEHELAAGNATEHTHRPALKHFIESLAGNITATNEPKRVKCGAPDYIVTSGQTPLGYIEAKDVNESLDKVAKSEQIKRYLESLSNLILTDYLEFRWYVEGEHRMTARLAQAPKKSGKLKVEANGEAHVVELLKAFLASRTATIGSPKELAERMAAIARLMRDAIRRALEDENTTDAGGLLHEQLKGFREVLLHDLTEEQFADMYAQTICYGLFAARCNARGGERFTRKSAGYDLPKTNPFLRKMFSHIAGVDLDERIAWAVDDLAELLDRAKISDILANFGKRTRREDPVVHFYETFLVAYDPKLRQTRGVYYTPEPVVSYIVRSVDHILKNDFNLADGLADASKIKIGRAVVSTAGVGASRAEQKGQDALEASRQDGGDTMEIHRVLILDPATGTGTFLYSVIKHIYEKFRRNQGLWSGYVAEHLLPRMFGFELLMAAYAVAHMKLGLLLDETGYKFDSDERLRVYLTNTLDEVQQLSNVSAFTRWLNEEAEAAGKVKQDAPVMVVLGNPPYSGHSANSGQWMANLLRGMDTHTGKATGNYFMVDGAPLGERNPKWLNDDYVKFIRFAQWRIEQTGYGILAFITNHGYLDNPTFRGMRQSLMETFDDIYVLDLHGNSKKKERATDGGKDENVFDIQQGVAIGIFVKRKRKRTAVVPTAGLEASRFRSVQQDTRETREQDTRETREQDTRETREQDTRQASQQDAGGTSTSTSALARHTSRTTYGEVEIRNRGRLPHWEKEGGTYFVTFRLGDSLPQSVLKSYEAERGSILRTAEQMKRELSYTERKRLDELFSERIETYLDTGAGACHLANPQIAELVANALRYFNGERYKLFAWCVMPNHVHVVMRLYPNHKLAEVLHSWKSFTAKEANRLLNRKGEFWQREYYDHLVRDEGEFARIIRYVLNNPVKAKLEKWEWVEACTSVETTIGESASADQSGGQDARQPASVDAGGTNATGFANVRHAHLHGVREIYERDANDEQELAGGKYYWLRQHDVTSTNWTTLEPNAPFYLFVPQNTNLRAEYESGWKVTEMMPVNVLGFQTHRDHFAIDFDETALRKRIVEFRSKDKSDEEIRDIYGLGNWNFKQSRIRLREDKSWGDALIECLYRPFDKRACYYSDTVMDRPRRELIDQVEGKENLCFLSSRQQATLGYKHCWVAKEPPNDCVVSTTSREANQVFPLYLYPVASKGKLFDDDEPTQPQGGRRPNLAPEFIKDFAARLKLTFIPDGTGDLQRTFAPEDIFNYMYAIFHSPTYRTRYAEFLKIDFPRLPLTSNVELFRALCSHGAQLVRLHLMDSHGASMTGYPIAGDNRVEQVRYEETSGGRVWINRTQFFEGVPPEVWNFHVGGYQVPHKWLKDRKGRALTYDDLTHYQNIVSALAATIRLMQEIDANINAHGGFPIQ